MKTTLEANTVVVLVDTEVPQAKCYQVAKMLINYSAI